MTAAMKAVVEFGIAVKRAAIEYDLPRRTLQNYFKHPKENVDDRHLGRFETIFTTEQETEIVQHILSMEQRFYGLTTRVIRILDFQVKNEIQLPSNNES